MILRLLPCRGSFANGGRQIDGLSDLGDHPTNHWVGLGEISFTFSSTADCVKDSGTS